jgi:hypothetical protein
MYEKNGGRKSRETFSLNGRSHEKVGEIRPWDVSLGCTEESAGKHKEIGILRRAMLCVGNVFIKQNRNF